MTGTNGNTYFNFIFSVDKDMYDHATLPNLNGMWTLIVKYLYRPTETKNLFNQLHEERIVLSKEDCTYTEQLTNYYNKEKPEIMEINTTKYEAFRWYFNRWVFLRNNPDFKLIVRDYFNKDAFEKDIKKVLNAYKDTKIDREDLLNGMHLIRESVLKEEQPLWLIYKNIYTYCLIARRSGELSEEQTLKLFDGLYETTLNYYWANNCSELYVASTIYSDKIRAYLTPIKTVRVGSLKEIKSMDQDFDTEKLGRSNVENTFNRGFMKSLSNPDSQIILYSTLIGNTILSVTGNKELEDFILRSNRKVVLPDTEFKPLQINDLSDVHEAVSKAYELLLQGSPEEIKQLCEKLGIKYKANNLEKTVASIIFGCSKESLTDEHKSIINIITRMLKKLKKNKVSLEEYRADMDFANSDEYAEANKFLHGEGIKDSEDIDDTEQEDNKDNEIEETENEDAEYEDDYDDDEYLKLSKPSTDENSFSWPEGFTEEDKEQDKIYGETLYPEEQYLNDISTTFKTNKKWIDEERLRNLIEKHELRNWSLSNYIEQAKEFIQKHNIKELTPNVLEEMFLIDGNNYYHWSKKYFKDGKVETFLKALNDWEMKHSLGKMLGRISFKPDTDIKSFKTVKDLAVYESQISRIHAMIRKNKIQSEWVRRKATSYPIFTARAIMRKLNAENVDYLRHVFNIPEKNDTRFETFTKELYAKLQESSLLELPKHEVIACARIYANMSTKDFIKNAGLSIAIRTWNKWITKTFPNNINFMKLYDFSVKTLYSINEYIARNVLDCSKTAVCDAQMGEAIFGNPVNHYLWIRSALIRRASKQCNKATFCEVINNDRYNRYELGTQMPNSFAEWCEIEEALNGKLPKTVMNKIAPYGQTRMITVKGEYNKNNKEENIPTVDKQTFEIMQEQYKEELNEYKNKPVIDVDDVVPEIIGGNKQKDIVEDFIEEIERDNKSDIMWLTINITRDNGKEEYAIKRKVRVDSLDKYLNKELLDSIIL